MTPPQSTAEGAAAALKGSKDKNAERMAQDDESRVLLTSVIRAEMRDEMQLAVSEGIKAAMTPEAAREFADVFLTSVEKKWTERVDRVAGNVVRKLAMRLLTFVIFGSIVYAIGGWSGLAAFGKWAVNVSGVAR